MAKNHLKTALRPSGALCGENWGAVAADTKPAAPLSVAAGVSSLLDDVQIVPVVAGKRGVWVRGRSKPLVAWRVFAKRG